MESIMLYNMIAFKSCLNQPITQYTPLSNMTSLKAPPLLYLVLLVEYSTNDFMATRRPQTSIDIHTKAVVKGKLVK